MVNGLDDRIKVTYKQKIRPKYRMLDTPVKLVD